MPRKIVLDCDPGRDDAVALLLAHGSPEVDPVAVTTVVGNQSLDEVTRNARAIAHVIGLRGVPIAAGCARPLLQEPQAAAGVHGESGLDGVELPEPDEPLDPRNASPVAEPTIATDPEAARIVVGAGWPVTVVGLDLTHQALATPDVVERIRAVGTAPSRSMDQLLAFASAYRDSQGFDAPPVHDPCAVARVIDPSVVTTRRAPLDVELTGTLTRGMTVADPRGPAPLGCVTSVAVELDRERFWDLVVDALERVGEGPGGAA